MFEHTDATSAIGRSNGEKSAGAFTGSADTMLNTMLSHTGPDRATIIGVELKYTLVRFRPVPDITIPVVDAFNTAVQNVISMIMFCNAMFDPRNVIPEHDGWLMAGAGVNIAAGNEPSVRMVIPLAQYGTPDGTQNRGEVASTVVAVIAVSLEHCASVAVVQLNEYDETTMVYPDGIFSRYARSDPHTFGCA